MQDWLVIIRETKPGRGCVSKTTPLKNNVHIWASLSPATGWGRADLGKCGGVDKLGKSRETALAMPLLALVSEPSPGASARSRTTDARVVYQVFLSNPMC
jgi:hypothetical protein